MGLVLGYQEVGYVDGERTDESVPRTQDFSLADFAVSVLAEGMGRHEDAESFRRRSHSWTNLWNRNVGTFRPRNGRGEWLEPSKGEPVTGVGRTYTEADEETTHWCVPHDLDLLFEFMGGPCEAERTLDRFCADHYRMRRSVHANEPAHHIPYVYNRLGAYDKCARTVRWILEHEYTTGLHGLNTNDDCGQMSSWYVLSALGFYPLNPPDATYEIGSPIVDAAEIRLGPPLRSAVFRILVKNQSKRNALVRSVRLNGRELRDRRLRHADILAGGTLEFEMAEDLGR